MSVVVVVVVGGGGGRDLIWTNYWCGVHMLISSFFLTTTYYLIRETLTVQSTC